MPIANLESFAISDRVGAVRFDVRARPRARAPRSSVSKRGRSKWRSRPPRPTARPTSSWRAGWRQSSVSTRATCSWSPAPRENARSSKCADRQRGHAGAARRLHQVSARIPKRAHPEARARRSLREQLEVRDARAAFADGAHQSEPVAAHPLVIDHDEHLAEEAVENRSEIGDRAECLGPIVFGAGLIERSLEPANAAKSATSVAGASAPTSVGGAGLPGGASLAMLVARLKTSPALARTAGTRAASASARA